MANLITVAGADRVLTLDLHAGQIQGFFDIPTDNLFAAPGPDQGHQSSSLGNAGTKLTIVSPDVGGVVRARAVAKRLDADLAIIDKRRERAGVSEVMNIIGDVSGQRCILVDDIVDSLGHVGAEARGQLVLRRACVLDDVVQDRRDDRVGVQVKVREDRRGGDRVGDEGFAGVALLAVVRRGAELGRLAYPLHLLGRQVAFYGSEQFS